MLPKEIEEGNIEYKRLFKNINNSRFIELSNQMNWRLDEGNGICYYYIGVNDNGTIYKDLTDNEINYSLKLINSLAKKCISFIYKTKKMFDTNKNIFFKITIKRLFLKKLNEKRVLLIGDTKSGKTTFLAYLIKNKLNGKNFILSHKHELESGKTSSITYQSYIYKDTKIVFIDTPGSNEYYKTSIRALLSINFDLIICFSNNDWDKYNIFYNYAKFRKIPFILNTKFPKLNLDEQNKHFKIIFENMKKGILKKNLSNVNFNIFNIYPHPDLGWILSGFLSSGKVYVNQNLKWYKNNASDVKISSIYYNNHPVTKIEGPVIITMCLKCNEIFENKPPYGFLSNIKINKTNKIKINWKLKECNLQKNRIYFLNKSIYINNINNNILDIEDEFINFKTGNNFFIYKNSSIGIMKEDLN